MIRKRHGYADADVAQLARDADDELRRLKGTLATLEALMAELQASSGTGGGAVSSVFARTGAVVAVAGDYAASEVSNDSGVAGASVADALDTLDGDIAGLGSDDIANDSGVAGATVSDALDTLAAASGGGAGFGVYASRPAAGSAGAEYYASDSPIAHWVDDGAAWRPIIGGQIVGNQAPNAASWTLHNAHNAIADLAGTLLLTGGNDGSSYVLRGYTISLSSSSAYVECCPAGLGPAAGGTAYPMFVFGMRESGTGKAVTMIYYSVLGTSQAQSIGSLAWTNNTTASQINSSFNQVGTQPIFLRVIRISGGTILSLQVSRDRINWAQTAAYTLSSYFTVAPDQIFIGTFGLSVVPVFGVHHLQYGT